MMSNIPPAPPLPTARPHTSTTRSAFARFVTQPFTRPSQHTRQDGQKSSLAPSHHAQINGPRAGSSQHSSLTTRGAEITSLDKSKDGTLAILAGRNILKTIKVNGTSCSEGFDIRAALINQDGANATKPLDIYDVKWSHGEYGSHIATATASGRIVVYDIAAHGIESWRMHEHSRSVFRLAVNPHSSPLLLSASHDSSVILWDLRDARPAQRVSSRDKYKTSSGGVRDVKWSPTDGTEFAFATDSGSVQKWDFRHNSKAKLKINAHEKYCTAIDWHPDGKHLVSAGHDKWIKIWDVASGSKRQRAQWFIRTPFPVANVCWRPEYWAPEEHGGGSWQCTQIIASYDRQYNPVVHLWDVRRPHMPHREMYCWNSAPSDMLWHDQRFLWTVDRDGVFQQNDIHYAPKVIDRRPMQALALSPAGELCVFTQKRPRQKPRDVIRSSETSRDEGNEKVPDEGLDNGRNTTEADLDHNYLSTSYKRTQHRSAGTISAKSAASTPPSYSDNELHRVAWLSDSLTKKKAGTASQSQIAYRGFVDGSLNAPNFIYLAQKYKTTPMPIQLSVGAFDSIGRIFEQNASYAQKTGAYRVAQTWRVFNTLIHDELYMRASANRRRRLAYMQQDVTQRKVAMITKKQLATIAQEQDSVLVQNNALRAVQSADLAGLESTSNVQTPLAAAQAVVTAVQTRTKNALPDPEHEDLLLPPLLVSHNLTNANSEIQRPALHPVDRDSSSFSSRNWFPSTDDINDRRQHAQNWRAASRQPLDFGYQESPQNKLYPPLQRHDSNDSFGMFSASSDSQGVGSSFKSVTSDERNRASSFSKETGPTRAAEQIESKPALQPSTNSIDRHHTQGDLSWLTSSSSMDFGGRNLALSGVVNDERPAIVADSKVENLNGDAADRMDELVLADFVRAHPEGDNRPVSAAKMLEELYDYYTIHSPNAQAIHHIAMMLKPLLNLDKATFTSTDIEASASPFAKVKQSQEDAILLAYYDQLQTLQVYNPSVDVARHAQEKRVDPVEGFTIGSQVGLVCLDCKKPINDAFSKFRCENCGKKQASCPVCWQKYPAIEARRKPQKVAMKHLREWDYDPVVWAKPSTENAESLRGKVEALDLGNTPFSAGNTQALDGDHVVPQTDYAILWQSCLVCGHGAHAACLQHIQIDPKIGGKCPTDGCLCDCIPGTYRSRLNRETNDTGRKGSISWVRGDTSSLVGESGAVKGARALLDREQQRDGSGLPAAWSSHDRVSRQQQQQQVQQDERRVRVVEPKSRKG